MRSTYCPGVCTKPGTCYQGWFMYMRYTQGQNEEYLLSRRKGGNLEQSAKSSLNHKLHLLFLVCIVSIKGGGWQ